ncbi:hypothetical protein GOACH_56_00020, partial [Gordonia aichiensis NBRC 108223]
MERLLAHSEDSALVWACVPGAYSLGRTGRIGEALKAAELGHRTQIELDAPMDWYPCMHRFYAPEAHVHAGWFARAEQISRAEYEAALVDWALEAQALFSCQRAKAVTDCGDPYSAIRRLRG